MGERGDSQKLIKPTMLDLKELREAVESTTAGSYAWRAECSIDADYHDGRMLDPDQARRMEEAGIRTQSIGGNLIHQAVRDATAGAETNRRDAKLTAAPGSEEPALKALQEKMLLAEQESRCDAACLDAHQSQAKVGLGWVGPERLEDPFGPKYAVRSIHVSEMFWPQTPNIRLPEVEELPFLLRRRWTSLSWALARYPEQSEQIKAMAGQQGDVLFGYDWHGGVGDYKVAAHGSYEGGLWLWNDPHRLTVCLTEAYVARYRKAVVIDLGEDRVEEFDIENIEHVERALESDVYLRSARVRDIEKTLWCGNVLIDGVESLRCRQYPYVPFVYYTDDKSGYPYGIARILRPLQNERVQRLAAGAWAMGAMRIVRTEGIVRMPDDIFRRQAGSKNADYVLDARAVANGGRFEFHPGWQESAAHYDRVREIDAEAKAAAGTNLVLEMVPGIGSNEIARAGFEQQAKATAMLRRQYDDSRLRVLSLLLDMVIEDSLEQETVRIPDRWLRGEQAIEINVKESDGRITNDVRRLRARIVLEDVPSSPEKSKQELISLTELGKSLSPEFRDAMVPYVVNATSLPFKSDLVEKFGELAQVPTAEQIEADKQAAVEAAVGSEELKLKARELDIKEVQAMAAAEKIRAETSTERSKTVYTATQAAGTVVQNAAIAPAVEEMLGSVGFDDQNGPTAFGGDLAGGSAPAAEAVPRQNTSPQMPPVAPEPAGMAPAAAQIPIPAASPAVGAQEGIETDELEELRR